MSQEIIEAVREIERDKGIDEGALVMALEDALLAAYKKTPGASRHAQVEMDDRGDFRVYSIELPPDIEERLMDEARERKLEELERLVHQALLDVRRQLEERLMDEARERKLEELERLEE